MIEKTLKHVKLIVSFLLVTLFATPATSQQVKLHRRSVVEFATRQQAAAALTRRDDFINALSDFDRQCRLQAKSVPTTEQYLEFVKKHIATWSDDQLEKTKVAIESAAKKMEKFKIPFPEKVLFVTTDGKEEGGAAYCRGPAVILPQNMLKSMSARNLERLIIHELFHVLSNQNPELRKKLYSIIGFRPCGEINLPDSLAERKLTNPDGPRLDYYLEIKVQDQPVKIVPFLFSKTKFDERRGGTFFAYMQFQLLAVEEKEGKWSPVLKDGKPVFYSPNGTPDYFEKIGMNTNYIIHPDEVLADNFVFMVQEKQNLKTPRIPQEMAKLLKAADAQ